MGSKIEKVEKIFTAEITINRTIQRLNEDTYDKRRDLLGVESNELSTMTIKATSLPKLVEKINAHTSLLSED